MRFTDIMSGQDILGLVVGYSLAFGLLIGVEVVGWKLRLPLAVTRKFVHVGAGFLVFVMLIFFDHWYIGIIPFGSFIVLNYVFWRRQTFKSLNDRNSSLGTVYFAISVTVLFAWLWRTGGAYDRAPLAVAAVMTMTVGDACAALVGQAWGRHRVCIFGSFSSLEGSAAMAASTFVVVLLTLLLLPASELSPASLPISGGAAIRLAATTAMVATAAEATSPRGTDNLTVPILSAVTLVLLYPEPNP